MRMLLFQLQAISQRAGGLRRLACAMTVGMAVGLVATPQTDGQLVDVAYDGFELHNNMVPFTRALPVFADGTDWTKNIPDWTIDNSQMGNPVGNQAGGVCTEPAYNGWSAMDVVSWTAQQGGQGRSIFIGTNAAVRNTVLVADPDAYEDFDTPVNNNDGYNSYISRSYNLTGYNVNQLKISLNYEFFVENNQRGLIQVSFDGGANWQTLLSVAGGVGGFPNDTLLTGPVTYSAGTDFAATSNNLILRFGCVTADNNWWFAIDNILVETVEANGFSDLEDFEGLTLTPFTVAPAPTVSPYDGTDWTDNIPNWTINNNPMLGFSREAGFDGWNVLDLKCWVNQQGGQGRSLFVDPGNDNFNVNGVLVADGDAFYDFGRNLTDTGPAPAKAFNSYISRQYQLSGFVRSSLQISFDYEFRVENEQLGTAEVSFDGGSTWQTLLSVTETPTTPDDAQLADSPVYIAGTDFTAPAGATSMILRFGYLNADNNWWMAIDNVLIRAEEIDFLLGDANGDGFFDFGDIDAFVLALLDFDAYLIQYPNVNVNAVLDFDGDSVFTFGDIEGFVDSLLGGRQEKSGKQSKSR